MAPNPFRACDLCGTGKAPRPWTLIDATRKMACATCTPAAQAEGRKARKVLKRYHCLLKNRMVEEPAPLPGLGLYNGYRRIKAQYPDAVLIYRTGYRYTALDSDAQILHRELGLQLSAWQPHGLDRASFPFQELESYLPRLVKAGYRVAICDELEGVADGPRNEGDGLVSEPLTRYERIDRKRTEERFSTLITVLGRHGALVQKCDEERNTYEWAHCQACDRLQANEAALRAELKLHRVWLSKYRSIHFGLNGTKCNCDPLMLPELLRQYLRNASGRPFGTLPAVGRAPANAIGNFDTDADSARTLRYAEHNVAEARAHALAVPALIDHWQKHLNTVRDRMGFNAVPAGGHSVKTHAQAA